MNRRILIAAVAGASLLAAAGCASTGGAARDEDVVVYHLSEGLPQASNGLRNIGNHLEVNPKAKIVVVAHAQGVDYLVKGARDKNGNKYEDIVERLKMQGVRFEVCEITLRNRKLSKDQFIADATYVPSGVAELSKLQHQGYSYIKP